MKRKNQSTLHFNKSSNSLNSVGSSSNLVDTASNSSSESEPIDPKTVAKSPKEVSEDLGTLDSGPSRPILDKYVKNAAGRCFHSEWYKHYEWLEYSMVQNKAYCFACRHFSTSTSKSELAFRTNGFSNWKKANTNISGFSQHDKSKDHKLAIQRWIDHKLIHAGIGRQIDQIINPSRIRIVQSNREYLRILFEMHRFFTRQELSYRGHDETIESNNQGNWAEYLKLELKINPKFRQLHTEVTQQYNIIDYFSKTSSNDFIECLAHIVRMKIKNEIEQAKVYAVLIDESKDNAGKEELSICFRYLVDSKPVERFFCLKMLKDLDAEAIANVVKSVLQSGLSARLIALGADGASVMSGCNSSVFTKLKKEYPCTLYVHCACHRLNLIVVGLFKSCKVFDCLFSVIRKLHEIFSVSKYKIIFECQQRELYTSSSDRVMEIQAIKEVRWEIHYNSIFSFNFELVRNECEKVRIMVKNGIQFDINMYENLKKIIDLINTIPVTTASVERSFSTMNRVISWVRNSIDKERASDLILLSVEKELVDNLDLEEVIDFWARKKKRILPC